MSNEPDNLVLDILQTMRSEIRADMSEVKQRLSAIEVQVSAMGQQLAGLSTAFYSSKGEMDEFRRRLERVERRLALRDSESA
ncbi:hypothetical protein CKO42_02665 [Lamprobacter modestohalophilus]|uniref:Uncharacterized protein n=1 Tax=Lamprobacter modestohalophilus TaxID=1064514 RepID=A0A9X0W6W9_9GAMM|nr:hypothetical protein [Lamprobacter modestohalophilus]MBK1617373.1 hypothetical protein [Lamprobacter modestohalophilus]